MLRGSVDGYDIRGYGAQMLHWGLGGGVPAVLGADFKYGRRWTPGKHCQKSTDFLPDLKRLEMHTQEIGLEGEIDRLFRGF